MSARRYERNQPLIREAVRMADRAFIFDNSVLGAAVRHSSGTVEYGALRANLPSDQELAELRRQQASFSKTTRQIDIQNSWFAAPVLAAPLAVMGLEAAGGWILGEAALEAPVPKTAIPSVVASGRCVQRWLKSQAPMSEDAAL